MVKSKITEAGCRRGLGCGLLKSLFHPIPQHPLHNSGLVWFVLVWVLVLFFFPMERITLISWDFQRWWWRVCRGCSRSGSSGHWAGSPSSWQQVALQFKGIAVEGFHNTPDRDAKVGVARHWEQEGPGEIKKYIYKNQSFPIADQY